MAELTSRPVGQQTATGDKPGTQNLLFTVSCRDEPGTKMPLFRLKANVAAIKDGKLSAFWEAVRTSMWPYWDKVKDVEKLRTDPKHKETPRPFMEVSGLKYERAGFTEVVTSNVTVPFDKLPYKAHEITPDGRWMGTFCYDPSKGTTLPIQKANVNALIRAMRIQLSNPDTMGDDEAHRLLWIPGTPDQGEEQDAYERNLGILETWCADPGDPKAKPVVPARDGKIVDWEFEVYTPSRR